MKRPLAKYGIPIGLLGGGGVPAKIYGVSWNKGSSPTLTRTDDAVGMVANAGVDATPVVNDFDIAEIYGSITEVTDSYGNVFVRIPKFYIEKTDGAGSKTWRISKNPFGSAYLPECFNGANYLDIGKYTASLNGTKLESKASTYPLINTTIVNMRTYATNNGAGYQQLDIHAVDVLQTLFYVEFATLNSQAIMSGFSNGRYNAGDTAVVAESGVNRIIVTNAVAANFVVGQAISIGTSLGGNQIFYGRTITSIDVYDASNKAISFDGAAVDIAIGNVIYSTGWMNGALGSVVATSGSLVSNSTGKYPCKYRGVENPWANIWQFVDGLNINDHQAWICRTPADYASNLFAVPYVQLAYANVAADGYIVEMGWDSNNPFACLPINAIGGGATTYYSDYYYQSAGQKIALLGGNWENGAAAGLSSWALGYASSNANVRFGSRLLRKAL